MLRAGTGISCVRRLASGRPVAGSSLPKASDYFESEQEMRKLGKCVYSAILMAGLLVGGLAFAGPSAQASPPGASEAYYLFYQNIPSIHLNCAGANHYIKNIGDVSLSPYRIYQVVSGGESTNGYFQTYTYWDRGFRTADKQEWCRSGDFVYEYFGVDKVRREIQQHWYCSGGGCAYLFTYTGPWRNYNWA
jgi:hypothetical protein